MARRAYAGAAPATTLSVNITATSTTFTAADLTGYPTGTTPFIIVVARATTAEEKMLVTRSGNTVTVTTRGFDGTTAQAHIAGDALEHVASAVDFDEANALVNLADAKGDIIAAQAADLWTRVSVGSDGQVLTAASTGLAGVAWGYPAQVWSGAALPTTGLASGRLIIATGLSGIWNQRLYVYRDAQWRLVTPITVHSTASPAVGVAANTEHSFITTTTGVTPCLVDWRARGAIDAIQGATGATGRIRCYLDAAVQTGSKATFGTANAPWSVGSIWSGTLAAGSNPSFELRGHNDQAWTAQTASFELELF